MNIHYSTNIEVVNKTLVFIIFMVIALVSPLMVVIAMTIIDKYKDIDSSEPTTQVQEVYEANNISIGDTEFNLIFDGGSIIFEY